MPPATYIYEQRTRILVNPSRYLSTSQTHTLTGHTPHTLSRLVEEGRLTARRVGAKSFAFQTASVLAYCRKHNPTLTLFDLLATAEGTPVTEDELNRELNRARSGTWWTLARRDHAPPDWPTWQNWYRGDTIRAQAALFEQRPEWVRQIKEQRACGLLRRTLWLPAQPLGRYGEYCLARYQNVSAVQGSIRVLATWKLCRRHVNTDPVASSEI